MVSIKGYVKGVEQSLKDKAGYIKRKVEFKRLEKYSNEIDAVLTKYNKKSCDETMMVKGLRKSNAETTNRKTHQEDLEKIVVQMAKGIGLNEEIVRIMGRHHDIGHTFLGHSGEWWISAIGEDYGIGYYCHNTLGARELIYTDQVYNEIIEKIKVHNPNVNPKIIEKIRKSLWLIMDGINAHNGEKPEKQYIPQIHKTQEEFVVEMIKCYCKKGYDREIVPATPEACLMRLADQISYIPLDMLDGLREKMIRDENGNIVTQIDDDYRKILLQIGITDRQIDECNAKGTFSKIAERIKETFINDAIANSTPHKITMSKEMMTLMNKLRDLNNSKIVDYVVLQEDQATFPSGIRTLMNRYKDIILDKMLLSKLRNASLNMSINKELAEYKGTPDEGFINYICNMNREDFEFTKRIVRLATKQSISDELDIARKCVLEGTPYKPQEEFGLDYGMRNARIEGYIKYYEEEIKNGGLIGYDQESKEVEVENIMNNLYNNRLGEGYISMAERISLSIAEKYISTLNDHEFLQTLQDTEIITSEQYKSLTRKYRDIDLKKEAYLAKAWKKVKAAQKQAAYEEETPKTKQETK